VDRAVGVTGEPSAGAPTGARNLSGMAGPRVTIKDVARAAGVSATTVSQALNDRGRVREETRRRVTELAAGLGYEANPLAANLRRGTFGTIGLALPPYSLNYSFYSGLMAGAAQELFEAGIQLSLIPPTAAPQQALAGVDGVIFAEPRDDDPVMTLVWEGRTPMVLTEAAPRPVPTHAWVVQPDHTRAVADLLDHLSELGARRVGVLIVDDTTWYGAAVSRALDSWESTHDLRVVRGSIPFGVRPSAARAAVRRLLDDPSTDAIIAFHEGLGAPFLAAATRRGRAVPGDLLVAAGVDGPELLTIEPPVTSIDLNPRELGRLAARLLMDQPSQQTWTIAPTLRRRGSTSRIP